ncbi:MAG: hypothetical protein F9K19_25240 [Rhizobiaceae bacterium]|nr:MAG: hypothetical protein F9K19_25240 [Rhizobiaceae bacterium]
MTKRPVDLFPFLARRRDLLSDIEFARRLHIPSNLLVAIVSEGLGPDLAPAEASGRFWFLRAAVPSWLTWVRKGPEEEVNRVAEIVREFDRAQLIREYAAHYNKDARSFLTHVFTMTRR